MGTSRAASKAHSKAVSKTAKSKTQSKVGPAKVESKSAAKVTPKPLPYKKLITKLCGINAHLILLSHYLATTQQSHSPHIIEDTTDTLAQTILPGNDDEFDTFGDASPANDSSRKDALFFLDVRKNPVKCWVTMYDVLVNGCLPRKTNIACRWCTETFTTSPLGCPIKYHPKGQGSQFKDRIAAHLKAGGLPTDADDFFETDFIFCSEPCCKGFILSQKNNPRYKESASLLTQMTARKYGKIIDIPVASDPFRTLKKFGGKLTIKEFRMAPGRVVYEETTNVKRPYMYASPTYLAERKIKLFRL